jgi:hypothetical protein
MSEEPVVSSLHIYPIKSCGAIDVQSAYAGARGFRVDDILDRSWMVVDAKGEFISQRKRPELARIRPSLVRDPNARAVGLTVSVEGMSPIRLDPNGPCYKRENLIIHGKEVFGHLCADELNEWFSDYLHAQVRLVFQKDEDVRLSNPNFAVRPGDAVSFADGFPYLVTTTETLRKLNSELYPPVPMTRFRPNVVVAGAPADVEYSWQDITVGKISMRLVKPCTRCVMTTIDQDTGQKIGREPLANLAKRYFLRHDFGQEKLQGAVFGQNAIATNHGLVSVGDAIRVETSGNIYSFQQGKSVPPARGSIDELRP